MQVKAEKKMRHDEKRLDLLDIPLPTASYNSLKKRKKENMLLLDANHRSN